MPRKVCIVGWASTSRELAPFDDPQFEIWGLNEVGTVLPGRRFTHWFNLHTAKELAQAEFIPQLKWLHERTEPLTLLEQIPNMRAGTIFPYKEILLRYGSDYFTSSVAWMIAYAHFLGDLEELRLFGIDMCAESEYAYQRPCVEFWIGYLRGLGVSVVVPEQSSLFSKTHLYGIEEVPSEEGIITQAFIRERKRFLESEFEKAKVNYNLLQGAVTQLEMIEKKIIAVKRMKGVPPTDKELM